jgi:hypothetical protein
MLHDADSTVYLVYKIPVSIEPCGGLLGQIDQTVGTHSFDRDSQTKEPE